MLKVERISVMNMENAIRGARNPLNSWAKMDSYYNEKGDFVLGENDLSLAVRLAKAGSDHRKYLRQIMVSMDITAPLYWWKEFDTYKVGTVRNSCSTMHKVAAKEFERNDFSHEHLDEASLKTLDVLIDTLNAARNRFVETKNKDDWWQMIQLLPASLNQKSTIQLNYQVLQNIYFTRKDHRLDEWHTFCDWIKSLPHSQLIIGKN